MMKQPQRKYHTARAGITHHASSKRPTVGADTHTQYVISHLQGSCVVDCELPRLAVLLLHYCPLPKLDLLCCAAAHKPTAGPFLQVNSDASKEHYEGVEDTTVVRSSAVWWSRVVLCSSVHVEAQSRHKQDGW